jgi:GNAT superfamily N-acetyltransferase
MTCAEADLRPVAPPDGVTLEALSAASPLTDANALQRVQALGFGEEPEPYPERPLWLGHLIAVLARADGEPAGGGMCLTLAHGTTELVGIAVVEPFRRRGIAAAVTAELARLAFAHGALTAFLTPGDATATRVYGRAGFAPTDEMLHLRRP